MRQQEEKGWGCLQAFGYWCAGFGVTFILVCIIAVAFPAGQSGPDKTSPIIFLILLAFLIWTFACLIMAVSRSQSKVDDRSAEVQLEKTAHVAQPLEASRSDLKKGIWTLSGLFVALIAIYSFTAQRSPQSSEPVDPEISQPIPTESPKVRKIREAEKARQQKAVRLAARQERIRMAEAIKAEALSRAKLEAEAKKSLSKLRSKHNKVEEVTWYYPPSAPKYANSRSAFYPYFGISNGSALPVNLHIQYVGEDWVFMESVTIKTDTQTYNIEIPFTDRKSDNGEMSNGEVGVWEWYDTQASEEQLEMLKDMSESSDVTVRFNGQQYYRDKSLNREEKRAIKQILESFASAEAFYK